MFRHLFNKHWLYALAAIILLLQSFAVWHDAEHAFHTAAEQCERLNAINHLPVADITPELVVTVHSAPVVITETSYRFVLVSRPDNHYAIRAPPRLS